MNLLTQILAGIGAVVCVVPVLLVGAFALCHLLAKAKLRRDARLTALKTNN